MDQLELTPFIEKQYNWQNENFDVYIKTLKTQSLSIKKEFLGIEPFALTNNIPGINYLTGIYLNTFPFPDEEIFNKFSEFGISKKNLQWMGVLDDLIKEFNTLAASNVIVYKCEFMRHMLVHLSVQISQEVFKWAEITDPKRKFSEKTLTSELETALDRTKKKPARVYAPTRKKEIMNCLANEIRSIEEQHELGNGTLLRIMKGQITTAFYSDWLELSFPYTKDILKSNIFMQNITPLFRIILRGDGKKKIPEWEDIGQDQYKGKDLPTIQAQALRKWIYKR